MDKREYITQKSTIKRGDESKNFQRIKYERHITKEALKCLTLLNWNKDTPVVATWLLIAKEPKALENTKDNKRLLHLWHLKQPQQINLNHVLDIIIIIV